MSLRIPNLLGNLWGGRLVHLVVKATSSSEHYQKWEMIVWGSGIFSQIEWSGGLYMASGSTSASNNSPERAETEVHGPPIRKAWKHPPRKKTWVGCHPGGTEEDASGVNKQEIDDSPLSLGLKSASLEGTKEGHHLWQRQVWQNVVREVRVLMDIRHAGGTIGKED